MAAADEIQPGDPDSRRHALMALVVMAGVAIVVRHELGLVLADIESQAAVEPALAIGRMKAILGGLALLLSTGLLVLATVLAWIGRRTAVAARFPPPGMPVLADTRIRSGPAALRLARGAYAGAALLAGGALALYGQVERLATLLG